MQTNHHIIGYLSWIAAVRADELPGLTSFAIGLESDLDAVTAGLPLLRKRVLLTAAQR